MPRHKGLYQRQSGLIDIRGNQLVFTLKDASSEILNLDLKQLEVKAFGQNNAQYSLTSRDDAESRIVSQDLELLEKLVECQVKGAAKALNASKRRQRIRWLMPVSAAVFVLGFTLLLPLGFRLFPSDLIDSMVSYKTAKVLGSHVLDDATLYPRDDNVTQSVNALVDFLVDANPVLQSIPLEVYVSRSKEINAFAAPGGILVVNQGLLNRADSVEEVLGVLSHELAHIELRHNVRSIGSQVGIAAGALVLTLIIGSEAVSWIDWAPQLMDLQYSREFEAESDSRGFEYLRAAGVSADGAIRFFEKLMDIQVEEGPLLSILSTHPLSADRIASLRALQDRFPATQFATPPVQRIRKLQR